MQCVVAHVTQQPYEAPAWLPLCQLLEWNYCICGAARQLGEEVPCHMGNDRLKTKFGSDNLYKALHVNM